MELAYMWLAFSPLMLLALLIAWVLERQEEKREQDFQNRMLRLRSKRDIYKRKDDEHDRLKERR